MTIFTTPVDDFDADIDDFDYITVDTSGITVEDLNYDYELSTDALTEQTDRIMQELELMLARAYVTGAVAVDVTWYHMNSERTKVFDAKSWYDDPPKEVENTDYRDVREVVRYDLTQTSEEEFVEEMDRSAIDFSRLESFLSDE